VIIQPIHRIMDKAQEKRPSKKRKTGAKPEKLGQVFKKVFDLELGKLKK